MPRTARVISALVLLPLLAFGGGERKWNGFGGGYGLGNGNGNNYTFWKLTGLSGEFKLGGLYREHEILRPGLDDNANSYLLTGGILLNTNSYFWHPNLLLVNLSLEYSPEQVKDNYQIIPDQGEVRTLKKLDLRTTLFQKKIISLSSFLSLSQTYSNREFLSNIRTDSRTWGGLLFFRNSFLPLSVSYQQSKIEQEEVETSRLFSYENSILEGRASKSFGLRDKHELIYTHSEFKRIERELYTVKNKLDEVTLNNDIFFDKNRRYHFHSTIIGADQNGIDTLTRVHAFETLSVKLPWNFELIGNYTYYDVDRELLDVNQQVTRGMLKHKLFESLLTDIFYEYTDASQTSYDQTDIRMGFDISYMKRLPAGGQLNLSYNYLLQNQEKKGETTEIQVYFEDYTLTDGKIILLNRPYIQESSVVVRDVTGTVLYQLNLDYLLIPRGNFLEIQRVPGGQIPNNSTVYIDYTAIIPGSYNYDMNSRSWSAGISLFNKIIGLYYRNIEQDYSNTEWTDFITLNYITQHIYGFRTEYKAFIGGVEFDENNSSILPYMLKRYYLGLQGQFRQKWIYALNGNISDYHLKKEDINQMYTDISGQLAYNFSSRSKINLDLGYRHQEGTGIDLDLLNARLELSTAFRQLFLTLGVQSFSREYLQETDKYNSVYFRLSRRF